MYICMCNAPAEIYEFPTSADRSCKTSEGFTTPVTSSLLPPKPPRTKVKQYAWHNSAKKEVCMYIRRVNPVEIRKEKEELKFKSQEDANCQNHSDVIVSSVTIASPNSDVTIRERGINKPIAKKRYARKRSPVLSKGCFKSSLWLYNQTLVLITFILSMIISVVGGLCNIGLHEHNSTVGNSSESLNCNRVCSVSSFFILREFLATLIVIKGGLCLCNSKKVILNNNKQLIGYVKILRTTIRDEEDFRTLKLKRSNTLARPPSTHRSYGYSALSCETLALSVLAGKRFSTYIFPVANFWAFQMYYFGIYMVNLELKDHFKILFPRVYLYIYMLSIVPGYPVTRQRILEVFQTKYIFWSILYPKRFFW